MTSPFTLEADYLGADPGVPQPWRTDSPSFWLGDPATTGLIELPSPNSYNPTGGRGEVEHGLMSGVSAVTRFGSQTRRWVLGWLRLAGRDWQIVQAFYDGLFGDEWCYLPPEDRNRLTKAQSLCGGMHQAVEGWSVAAGTLAYDAVTAPRLAPSGVLSWTPAAAGALLTCQSAPSGVDTNYAAPNVPALPVTFVVWARTVTGTATLAASLSGRAADGTPGTTVTGDDANVGPSWAPVYVQAPRAAFGQDVYLVPQLISRDGDPVKLSCADLRYEDEVGDWEVGKGVPRVISAAPPSSGRQVDPHWTSSPDMTLAENVPGAG